MKTKPCWYPWDPIVVLLDNPFTRREERRKRRDWKRLHRCGLIDFSNAWWVIHHARELRAGRRLGLAPARDLGVYILDGEGSITAEWWALVQDLGGWSARGEAKMWHFLKCHLTPETLEELKHPTTPAPPIYKWEGRFEAGY